MKKDNWANPTDTQELDPFILHPGFKARNLFLRIEWFESPDVGI